MIAERPLERTPQKRTFSAAQHRSLWVNSVVFGVLAQCPLLPQSDRNSGFRGGANGDIALTGGWNWSNFVTAVGGRL